MRSGGKYASKVLSMRSAWVLSLFMAASLPGLAVRLSAPALVIVQSAAPGATPNPQIERPDPELDAAEQETGRALFLRCFCADNNLSFDAQGQLTNSSAKQTDWTLAGVNILKAERRPPEGGRPGAIELDAVRVAVRYASDRHEFERHPQNRVKLRILIAVADAPAPGSRDAISAAASFERALQAVFAQGIDLALQRSMPAYWQHYFNPQMPWPNDTLTRAVVATPGPRSPGVSEAVVIHKAQPAYTSAAEHDHVQGTVVLRLVVDAEGLPRRVAIAQPLGYGLDAEAAETAAKLRFRPAMLDGQPVASNTLLRQDFVIVPVPRY